MEFCETRHMYDRLRELLMGKRPMKAACRVVWV
jgi:hypothetical protein